MARTGSAARTKVKSAAKELKGIVKGVAAAARAVADTHGAKRSVTIIKGQTVSKDQPNRITVVKD